MFKISDMAKKLIIIQLILTAAAFVIGAFLIPSDGSFSLAVSIPSYGLGLALGFIFSALKLILLEKSLSKSVDMNKDSAQTYARFQYMLRYFLTFGVLVAAAVIKPISLLGTIIGIIMTQPAALIAGFSENRKQSR